MKIVSFCGHSEINTSDGLEEQLYETIEQIAKGLPVVFLLGGYGAFDSLAKKCSLRYKDKHSNSKLIFVTPYLNEKFLKKIEPLKNGFDFIEYPNIENVPKRFAILKRNEWMVKKSDFVIAYVNFSWGGAFKTFSFAKKNNKPVINLGSL